MHINILLAALFAALLVTAVVIIELVRVPDMYAVEGHGTLKYRPDAARISVGIVARADVAADAAIQASNGMAKVLGALKTAGVADADVSSKEIESGPAPQPDSIAGVPRTRIPNFAAVQIIEVKVRDTSRVAGVLNTITTAGANYWHVDFYISDEVGLQRRARNAALADAVERANAYATGGGFRRGKILKIQEGQTSFPEVDYSTRQFVAQNLEMGITMAVPPPPLNALPQVMARPQPPDFAVPQPEEATVESNVAVLFEIR